MPSKPSIRFAGHRCASLLVCALFAAGCSRPDAPAASQTSQAPQAKPAAPPALPVSVLNAEPKRLPVLLESVGRTEGSREVEVRARVTGILQKQAYHEGEAVAAGALLYRIDRAPFEVALAQATAALALERTRLERAQLEARRLEGLVGERAISQREYDDAISSRRQAEASVQAGEARVRDAELNLSYTEVTAPIAGITGRTQRSEGSLVSASADASLLTTLVQADPIWVRFSLSEPEYARLRTAGANGAVELVLPEGGVLGGGRLNFAASSVDARLGTVQLRAEFPNPGLKLLPGQFVRARIAAGQQDAVLVPQQAVLQGEQGRFVWIVDAEGKAAARPVETGSWIGRDWIVRSGLKAGDRVIVDNLIKVRPGAAVQPREPGPGASK